MERGERTTAVSVMKKKSRNMGEMKKYGLAPISILTHGNLDLVPY